MHPELWHPTPSFLIFLCSLYYLLICRVIYLFILFFCLVSPSERVCSLRTFCLVHCYAPSSENYALVSSMHSIHICWINENEQLLDLEDTAVGPKHWSICMPPYQAMSLNRGACPSLSSCFGLWDKSANEALVSAILRDLVHCTVYHFKMYSLDFAMSGDSVLIDWRIGWG